MRNFFKTDFKFSEDDREILWETVRKKFGPKKTTLFLDWLEVECSIIIRFKNQESRSSHRTELQKILHHFKQTQNYLRTIAKNFSLIPQRTFNDTKGIMALENFDADYFGRNYAVETFYPLQKLIKTLEDALKIQSPKEGRPKGFITSFIRTVAEDYKKILGGKPTNSGIFLKIIQQLLGILKFPFQNPRRAIREALKNPQ